MELTPHQLEAFDAITAWYENPGDQKWFTLGGYAGTGKTTLAGEFSKTVTGDILSGAFTGKAAYMMRRKGVANASTIHSLIYSLDDIDDDSGDMEFSLNPDSAVKYADLVMLDECSMINTEMAEDLLSFGTKILVLGDPGQLPPIEGTGHFNKPHHLLSEILRQAAENPIIQLSIMARERKTIPFSTYGPDCKKVKFVSITEDEFREADQILVGLNRTRRTINKQFRSRLGFTEPHPMEGEKIICLRNNPDAGLLNGMMFKIVEYYGPLLAGYKMKVEDDEGNTREVNAHHSHFDEYHSPGIIEATRFIDLADYSEFDYGYAITVHKAQGSQWDSVIFLDENFGWRDRDLHAKHLYTGITRAANKLILAR